MRSILIVGQAENTSQHLAKLISAHLPQANIINVKPGAGLNTLTYAEIRLIIYTIPVGKEVDLSLVNQLKSAAGKTPLLVYGRLSQMHTNMIELLNMRVSGVLSIDAHPAACVQAIDALLRGDSYVDGAAKLQALINLLRGEA